MPLKKRKRHSIHRFDKKIYLKKLKCLFTFELGSRIPYISIYAPIPDLMEEMNASPRKNVHLQAGVFTTTGDQLINPTCSQ